MRRARLEQLFLREPGPIGCDTAGIPHRARGNADARNAGTFPFPRRRADRVKEQYVAVQV